MEKCYENLQVRCKKESGIAWMTLSPNEQKILKQFGIGT